MNPTIATNVATGLVLVPISVEVGMLCVLRKVYTVVTHLDSAPGAHHRIHQLQAARHALRWCSGRECWGEAGKALQAANAWIVRLSIVAPQLVNTCLYQRWAHNLRDDDTCCDRRIQALV